MKKRTWRIIDYGEVPEKAPTVPYTCRCGYEAELPVLGLPLAQTGGGIVFDTCSRYAVPTTVQCRKCGRVLTTEAAADVR